MSACEAVGNVRIVPCARKGMFHLYVGEICYYHPQDGVFCNTIEAARIRALELADASTDAPQETP